MSDAARVLPLEGGFNFRDFGGYATEDGRRVKRGLLYRCGTMAHFTPDGLAALKALGIVAICDLRTNKERSSQPTTWHEGSDTEYWSRDFTERSGNLDAMLAREDISPQDLRDVMIEAYRIMPYQHASSFRAVFDRLLAGKVPLVVHCSAGKDRTGIVVALIQSVLGVPRDVIERDYLMTNEADFSWLIERSRAGERSAGRPRALLAPVIDADIAYIRAMFDIIESDHGSVSKYIADEIGVDESGQAQLKAALTDG